MKKTFLLSAFCFVLCAFGYTASDVSNANFLSNQGIITSQSSVKGYRLDDTITRAEAVGIALKIKGVTLPNSYTCKNYFTDVKYDASNNWICRAVEIAADEGLVSRNNTKFRPNDTITRVEALAIVMKAGSVEDISSEETSHYGYGFFHEARGWQEGVMLKAYHRYIIEDVTRNYNLNQPATRAEVFGFGRNIMNKKNIFFKANSEYTNIYFSFLYPSKHYVFSADTNTGILQNTVVQEKNKSITIGAKGENLDLLTIEYMNNIYGDNEILKHLNFEDRESCHEPYLKKTVLRSGVYLLQPLYKKVEELCNRNWRNATVYIEEKGLIIDINFGQDIGAEILFNANISSWSDLNTFAGSNEGQKRTRQFMEEFLNSFHEIQ